MLFRPVQSSVTIHEHSVFVVVVACLCASPAFSSWLWESELHRSIPLIQPLTLSPIVLAFYQSLFVCLPTNTHTDHTGNCTSGLLHFIDKTNNLLPTVRKRWMTKSTASNLMSILVLESRWINVLGFEKVNCTDSIWIQVNWLAGVSHQEGGA